MNGQSRSVKVEASMVCSKEQPGCSSADPSKSNETQNTMMMTSDVSLLHDDSYRSFVEAWAKDSAPFDNAFAHAWYVIFSNINTPISNSNITLNTGTNSHLETWAR